MHYNKEDTYLNYSKALEFVGDASHYQKTLFLLFAL